MHKTAEHSPDFRFDDWRQDVRSRRELARTLVEGEVMQHENIEANLDKIKRQISYHRLPKNDQENFRQMASAARRIAAGWNNLEVELRAKFLSSEVVYFSVLKTPQVASRRRRYG